MNAYLTYFWNQVKNLLTMIQSFESPSFAKNHEAQIEVIDSYRKQQCIL